MKPILEQIPLGKHKTISAFTYEKKNFETPWHFHPQNELTYIEESVGTKFIGDYVGAYAPGELVLLRSYLPHCWKNHSHSDKLSRSTVIQWNPDIIIELPELQSVSNMLNKASRGLIFSSEDTETLAPEILKLPYFHEAELYIELLRVLAKLASCPYATLSELSFQGDLPLEFNTRMTKVHDFVEKQFHRKIYLKELAALVNLSEQSFSRFFRKMMGRPFFTFLNEYRINMASRMLIDTDKSIIEVAYACGYDSLPFFHKQFKKFQQETPYTYRKKHRM